MPANAHKAFHQAGELPCFRSELELTANDREELLEARKAVRSALRTGLARAGHFLAREEYYAPYFLEHARFSETPSQRLEPKFRTQGSWAYKTLNSPANDNQQIDLDEGMYLPMSFVDGLGPAVASKGLYAVVETILGVLCEARGWTLDTSKSICVRIQISERAHLDVNIYAIPDHRVEELAKSAAINFGEALNSQFNINDALFEQRQLRLDPTEIYVAHRRRGWEQSDPLQLEDWFVAACDRHAHAVNVRRLVRYLKAWRDWRWGECGLSSITLMACAVSALDAPGTSLPKGRDDEALLLVAKTLSQGFAGDIPNPVVEGKVLNDKWDVQARNTFQLGARALASQLERALRGETQAGAVLDRLQALFGERFPDDESLVSSLQTIEIIRSSTASVQPSPKVGVSQSG